MDINNPILRVILITIFGGGLIFLLVWLDKKYSVASHLIRNGEDVATKHALDLSK